MSKTLSIYQRLSAWPLGRQVFSRLVAAKAPYFKTIRPLITHLSPGRCSVVVKDRKRVRNHLNTVHAIVMCNMAELAGGLALEAATPVNLRWIPRKMTVEYLKKAKGTLTGTSEIPADRITPGDVIVPVEVKNPSGETVFRAKITMYVTPKKPGS